MKKKRKHILKLSKILNEISSSVFITNQFGIITYINKAFTKQTKYSKREACGQTPQLLKSGNQDKKFYDNLWKTILSGKTFSATLINKRKDGTTYYEAETIAPIIDKKNVIQGFISTSSDITEQTLKNQELCRIAATDKLTGLYNRHKFEELFTLEVERSIRFKLPLALILLDIDNFKLINDTYGHNTGDELLKNLAAAIEVNIRKLDILSRWGGEEFLILAPNTNILDANKLAEKLRSSIENNRVEYVGHITVSIGTTILKDDDNLVQIFERADNALYLAKERGKNRVEYII